MGADRFTEAESTFLCIPLIDQAKKSRSGPLPDSLSGFHIRAAI